jgi:hypothetical protein
MVARTIALVVRLTGVILTSGSHKVNLTTNENSVRDCSTTVERIPRLVGFGLTTLSSTSELNN